MQEKYNVGIYCRLSRDDERSGESVSIENQRELLTRHAVQQGWTIYDYYIDNGVSGTTFDRPGFNRLVADATSRKINLVLCKDLSRLGRDYIEAGKYTDFVFPSLGCRFIALNDGVDTAHKNNEMLVIMKNVMNDLYARDTSEKIKAVKKSTFQAGKFIGCYAPIGYIKSPEDKHKLIPDPATAPIVRKIFALRCEGRSFRNIALTLNAEGIPTPRDLYYQSIGKENPRNENPYWSGTTVKTILRNEVYIGNMVQNKFGTLSYKAHKQVAKPQEEWIRVEHTHEPLVSKETWELVRSLDEKPTRRRTMNNGKMALFAGVVFCMDCGSAMRHDYETRPLKDGSRSSYEGYLCLRYSTSGKGACTAHVIIQRALIQIVLTDIRMKAGCAKQDPERLKEIIRQKRNAASEEQRKAQKAQLKGLERRLGELERLIPSTYEDKALGRIPEAVCIQLMKQYEAERQEKLAQKAELTAKLEISQQAEDSAEDWIAMIQDYSNLETLDRPTLLRLIDRIEIGERRKVNGQDERDIRIYYKFAGMVEV